MADVKSVESSMFRSKDEFVTVHVKGISDVQMRLIRIGNYITAGEDAVIAQAANSVQREVQKSIIGANAEPKSVDTGMFANSIEVNKVGKMHYKVTPEGYYPNGTSVKKIASILEYGTQYITERRHFRNTKYRMEPVVNRMVAEQLRKLTKR